MEAIRNRLFGVRNVPLFTNIDKFKAPSAFAIYKSEGGEPFGVLGKDFTPQQPKELFESFVQCLTENTQADLNDVEYHEMKDGAKIRFSVPVKMFGFKNKLNVLDETCISLNIQTGFDGYTATSLYLSMERLICTNGMKVTSTEFKSKFKNTIGNVGKIQLLCDDVTKAIDSGDGLEANIARLNSIEINTKRKNHFIKKVLGYNLNDKEELTTRKRNILESIEDSIALEISRSGGTLWGLLNGVTHYTNHSVKTFDSVAQSQAEYRDEVNQYIFSEHGAKMNATALEVALSMAN